MTGSLYQLGNKNHTLFVGQVVRIDGPYDTYGIVQSQVSDNVWLIRGLGRGKIHGGNKLVKVS